MLKYLPLLLSPLLLSACASNTELTDNPAIDYQNIKSEVEKGHYENANTALDKFPAKHPYSHYTIQTELLRAYSAYKLEQYTLSITMCEEFIQRHPRHPNVAYAKYLLGMSHYRQISGPEKDQQESQSAIDAFQTLIAEHPKSSYAGDAKNRLRRLYTSLAKHELQVGKFYYDRGRYVAAANRFQTIMQNYQTSVVIEEALYYVAASYKALNLDRNARDTAILLRHNYPNSEWSKKAKTFL
ncbi:MAG: outer membrane protein assembly factor BamD [Mariprofundaceae bacterium]